MEFDCLKSNDEVIQAKLPKFANGIRPNQSMDIETNENTSDGSINFKVVRKMEFNSDRKRMSVLLYD